MNEEKNITPEQNVTPETNIVSEQNVTANDNNIQDIEIQTVNIEANENITAKAYVEAEQYKVTGTADESELQLKKEEKEDEVLDEHAIKRDVQISDAKFKYNVIYVSVFTLVIMLFIILMPFLIKIIGM